MNSADPHQTTLMHALANSQLRSYSNSLQLMVLSRSSTLDANIDSYIYGVVFIIIIIITSLYVSIGTFSFVFTHSSSN